MAHPTYDETLALFETAVDIAQENEAEIASMRAHTDRERAFAAVTAARELLMYAARLMGEGFPPEWEATGHLCLDFSRQCLIPDNKAG